MFRERMSNLKNAILGLLISCAMACPAAAEIIISLDPAGSNIVDLGMAGMDKTIDFYIAQDAGLSDTLAAIFAEFTLDGGVIATSPGTVSTTGSTGTAGYYGAGNLDVSELNRTSDTSFNVNQSFDFESMLQPISNDPQRDLWFSLNLDTTGLAAGDYSITLQNPEATFFDPTATTLPANSSFSFTVSAVPEPSALALMVMFGAGSLLIRRKHG